MNLLMILATFLGLNMSFFGSGCGSPLCTIASNSLETSGQEVAIGETSLAGNKIAQSFYVASSTTVKKIQLKLVKVGTITAGTSLTVTIMGNSGGAPDSVPISSSMTLLTNTIATTATTYDFTPTEFTITPGTYWIHIQANYAISTTNYIKVNAHDGATGDYTSGQVKYFNGSVWTDALTGGLRDLVFSVGC